jgi:hypothetical protein
MSARTITPNPTETFAEKVIIHLIGEELKNRKLLQVLSHLGYDNTFYKADLTGLVLAAMGLPRDSPATQVFCDTLLDKHSRRVVENIRELDDEARRVYHALVQQASSRGIVNPWPVSGDL